MREARLKLVVADLLITGIALRTAAATAHEGQRYPVSCFPSRDIRTDRFDNARELVPRDVWQSNIGIVSHPAVPVAAAKASSLDGDDHASGGRFRVGQGFDCEWPAKFAINCRPHALRRATSQSFSFRQVR